ncbi:unnamed protein product [Schistosoma mattheei]|uniref:Uncharacterized protein n=1 Tax=Schistosoma mattheei TaxID=31246 RepID=A0A183PA27_9TREM|nr:unnamed protein product [Schistosoma mattheei]
MFDSVLSCSLPVDHLRAVVIKGRWIPVEPLSRASNCLTTEYIIS